MAWARDDFQLNKMEQNEMKWKLFNYKTASDESGFSGKPYFTINFVQTIPSCQGQLSFEMS